jgi:hypothetical protein
MFFLMFASDKHPNFLFTIAITQYDTTKHVKMVARENTSLILCSGTFTLKHLTTSINAIL